MRSRFSAPATATTTENPPAPEEWEVRPCGMLVQKRNPDGDVTPAARIPTIRIKVKHGAASHEIYISSQATFGELKKALSERTGLHHLDQKIIYKDKERDSAAYLDTAGVKDKSKLVLMEDLVAQAKRLLDMRKTEKMEKAAKLVSAITKEVDKLASKVSALEAIVNKGGRVVETDVVNLIELLMNQLVKLDGVVSDGDVKLQRRMQVKRVQKYIETLDVIKVKNAANVQPLSNDQINKSKRQPQPPPQPLQKQKQQQQNQTQVQYQQHHQQQARTHFHQHQQEQKPQPLQHSVTQNTDWEIYDSLFKTTTTPQAAATTRLGTATGTGTSTTRFDWELF